MRLNSRIHHRYTLLLSLPAFLLFCAFTAESQYAASGPQAQKPSAAPAPNPAKPAPKPASSPAKATPDAAASTSASVMTTDDVLRALALGDPADIIIARIQRNQTHFTDIESLIAAIQARDPDNKDPGLARLAQTILTSFYNKGAASSASTPPATSSAVSGANPSGFVALKLSPAGEAARAKAATAKFDTSLPKVTPPPSGKDCDPKKLCITLDWSQKSPTLMPLRRSGDYRFHAINLNDILYQYSMTGEAPTPSTDDLSLFQQLIKETQSSLIPNASGGATAVAAVKAAGAADKVAPCPLADHLTKAMAQLDALSKAISDLQPQPTGKTYPSVPLLETQPKVGAVEAAFLVVGANVADVQTDIGDPKQIPSACAEDSVLAAAKLITDQYPRMRSNVADLDARAKGLHTLDQEFHCEQTIGCSMSILESYAGSPTTANPNPWKSTWQATLSQLTISGGFLLTTLQARSYSSRTAPDPTAPTTKTVNVLGVDYSSGVRPALTALLNYHLPLPYTDWPKGGFALSAGPVIDVSSGKADTSRFGFFGGISAHLWNRFWITPGVHVGEFADTPQGFKGAGDIIPPNIGTPVPVKRYTARFAIAITFQGGNPASIVTQQKAASPVSPVAAAPAPSGRAAAKPVQQ
jgi:hypothetical protein